MLENKLTIKHLEMIHAIDAADSLTKAAELLNISQPAISSRLHDAEKTLGTALVQRRGRRLNLSPAGQLLLRSAQSILADLASVESELRNLPGQSEQQLRIAMPQYASFSWLPAAVTAFEKQFPAFPLEIVSEASVRPLDAVSRGDVDVALISSPSPDLQIDRSRLESELLIRDEFLALLPEGHPKARKPFLTADDFVDETYITNSAVPERNREYELFFQPNSVYPERVVQVGFTGAIMKLVAAGIGSTIITRWIIDSDLQASGVVDKRLTESGLYVNWFAVFPGKTSAQDQIRELCNTIASSGDRQ